MELLDNFLKANNDKTYHHVDVLLDEENSRKLEVISKTIGEDFEVLFINEILKEHFNILETELNVDLLTDSYDVLMQALADRRNSLRGY
ncbi:hypothetical protein P4607_23050 [Priestia megaterium]|uniref:hypothetical protein n=1 Tax=Priestia megaterium TaxID=1404 RepID=UPI002E228439|nr:hypothetical protein [Priestia megaterium]